MWRDFLRRNYTITRRNQSTQYPFRIYNWIGWLIILWHHWSIVFFFYWRIKRRGVWMWFLWRNSWINFVFSRRTYWSTRMQFCWRNYLIFIQWLCWRRNITLKTLLWFCRGNCKWIIVKWSFHWGDESWGNSM